MSPFLHALAEAGVTPLLSLGYCPMPLQRGPPSWQGWKQMPADPPAFADVCRQAADRWAFARPAFEVWNEPDLPGNGGKVFFAGNAAAYGRLYAAVAPAVWPARVGGPAIAYDTSYLTAPGVLAGPIDFVSVHAYGNAPAQLAAVHKAIGPRRVPIWMTEYASFADDSLPDSARRPAAVAAFFADVKRFLTEPGLVRVYWAQWVDESLGLLDSRLRRRPLFNAIAAYQTLLPTPRRPTAATGRIDAMAAADGSAAAVVVWNSASTMADVTVTLDHPPPGTATVYTVTEDSDSRLATVAIMREAGRPVRWSGRLSGGSSAIIRIGR